MWENRALSHGLKPEAEKVPSVQGHKNSVSLTASSNLTSLDVGLLTASGFK